MKLIDDIRIAIRDWRRNKCVAAGHQWYTDKVLFERPIPDHPDNDADYQIFEHTQQCAKCGGIYFKNFRHFRGGVQAFLERK